MDWNQRCVRRNEKPISVWKKLINTQTEVSENLMNFIKLCLKNFPGLCNDGPERITSTENGKKKGNKIDNG